MTRRILASGLLSTAWRLSGDGSGAGRPALSDLRRATSTAYYALFHQIIRHGAFDFLQGDDEAEIAEIARWFTHTGVLSAAQMVVDAASTRRLDQIKKEKRAAVMALRSVSPQQVIPTDLLQVAESFISLQEARHRADYDGNYDPVRSVTINHVQDAEVAVHATWRLWRGYFVQNQRRRQEHEAYACFLRLALLSSGGPKGR